jgi:hypothetical protein
MYSTNDTLVWSADVGYLEKPGVREHSLAARSLGVWLNRVCESMVEPMSATSYFWLVNDKPSIEYISENDSRPLKKEGAG